MAARRMAGQVRLAMALTLREKRPIDKVINRWRRDSPRSGVSFTMAGAWT
jgi:hypothetical protein